MTKVILYRKGMNIEDDMAEMDAAKKHFTIIHQRSDIQRGDLVIGRYSVLPFYHELETDIFLNGGILVNTFRQHQFAADMREWSEALGGMTPKTYDRLQDVPEIGPFVVKGQTNSKKFNWNTLMYAENKRDAIEIASLLRLDSLISEQEICVRKYVPLITYFTALNGLPITKEFRFFVFKGRILSGGFYWASHAAEFDKIPDHNEVPGDFLNKATDRIGDSIDFYTIDVAQTINGEWIVIEINDGSMSGLSCNDPEEMYCNLHKAISELEE